MRAGSLQCAVLGLNCSPHYAEPDDKKVIFYLIADKI